jgi:hypothetical protein
MNNLFAKVQHDLESIRTANNQDELTNNFKKYGANLIDLTNYAGKRQAVTNSSTK